MTRIGAVAEDEEVKVELAAQEGSEALLDVDFDGDDDRNKVAALNEKKLEGESDFNIISAYLEFVRSFNLLTKKDEVRLGRLIRERNDKKAKLQLFHANLRFVITIARRYLPISMHMNIMDLIQEGNIGLWTAVEKFDERKGFKFCTHAGWWIRQGIVRAFHNQEKTIRLPSHVALDIGKVRQVFTHFLGELGRQPDTHELAKAAGLSISQTENVLDCMSFRHISLNQPLSDSDDVTLSESIPDSSNPNALEISIVKEELHRYSIKMEVFFSRLALISRRKQLVFRSYYGFTKKGPQTLEQVGDSRSPAITRERVRQIIEDVWEALEDQGVNIKEMRSLLEKDLEAIHCLENIVGELADFKC